MTDEEFTFEVPATTAHLGPGFGVLGLALDVKFTVTVRKSDVDDFVVERLGDSVGTALDLRHDAILRGLRAARDRWKIKMPTGLAITVEGRAPRGCGLGTNSADFAAGIGTALRYAKTQPTADEALELVVELGSDPGHGAAALIGGLAIGVHEAIDAPTPKFRVLREPIHHEWRLAIVAPQVQTTTADVHRVVPASLAHGIVSRTSGRLVGLLRALATGDEDLLGYCLVDESHVPFRLGVAPGMSKAIDAAREAGAAGATISGHGPALVALTTDESKCEAIEAAMVAAFEAEGVETSTRICQTDGTGALPG